MRFYPYNLYTPTPAEHQLRMELGQTIRKPTNEEFISYTKTWIQTYRKIIEEEFPKYKDLLPFYRQYPYDVLIWRLGRSPVWGYKVNQNKFHVEIVDSSAYDHFDMNVIIFQKRLGLDFVYVDFESLTFTEEDAKEKAKRQAYTELRPHVLRQISVTNFEELIKSLLINQKVELKDAPCKQFCDVFGEVKLFEPDGSRRIEDWAFQVKSGGTYSLSQFLHDYHSIMEQDKADMFTLVIGGTITQAAGDKISKLDRVRVWDIGTICHMLNNAPEIAKQYFGENAKVFQTDTHPLIINRSQGYDARFRDIAPGIEQFRDYEDLCIEVLQNLFCPPLGEPKIQSRTADGLDIRDALLPNHAEDGVWYRIRLLVPHNFVVFEFKNWSDPINQDAIEQGRKYTSRKPIGKLCIIISRKGISESGKKAQEVAYRDSDAVILVITDNHLIEMVNRMENNEEPAAVVEDLIEEFMMQY